MPKDWYDWIEISLNLVELDFLLLLVCAELFYPAVFELCGLRTDNHSGTRIRKEFLRYFPDISESELKLVRTLFAGPIEKVCYDLQGELIDLKNDSTSRDMFGTLSIWQFWAKMCTS